MKKTKFYNLYEHQMPECIVCGALRYAQNLIKWKHSEMYVEGHRVYDVVGRSQGVSFLDTSGDDYIDPHYCL